VNWEYCGEIRVGVDGKLELPAVRAVPGVYRLVMKDGWHYIGEARDLSHRLWEYGHPTTGVIAEHRISQALKNAGGAIVEIMTSGNMAEKATRCSIEAEAIKSARRAGAKVLNGGDSTSEYSLSLDISYHEIEIEKLRQKLRVHGKLRE
jgi:hypothetical protein